MRNITITVYEFPELNNNAKQMALFNVQQIMFDSERDWYDDARHEFSQRIVTNCQYDHGEITKICEDIGLYLTIDFYKKYVFHGGRLGEYILKAFDDYLEVKWRDFYFEDYEIIDYCNDHQILFFEDGEIYQE